MTGHSNKLTPDPAEAGPVGPGPVEAAGPPGGQQPSPADEADWRARLDRLVESEKLTETLRKERDEYLELARRAQADLVNYRKRIARQQSEQLERAAEGFLVRLLPLVDALDAAAGQHPQTAAPLQKVLRSLLEAEGVERVEPTGEAFDPALCEAVDHQGEGDRQVVVEVWRPGFRWKGRLLRPASVKVRSEPSIPTPAASGDGAGSQSAAGRAGQE